MKPSERSNLIRFFHQRSGFLVVLILMGVFATVAVAGQQSGQLRTVRGTVVDSSNRPMASAIVYLKNMRTLAVRTYISSSHGRYRFSGLDPNVDYKLHAEHNNLTSAIRTVSSYDSRQEIIIELKVDRKKSEK
jgi:protocatechuate 3,4-dioxygenase beta subunit